MKEDKPLFRWTEKFTVYEHHLGWDSDVINEAIANGFDDPYIFAVEIFPTDVQFIYKDRFFVIEREDYLSHGTPWVLVELEYNEDWNGKYLSDKCSFYKYKRSKILGEWKTFKEFDKEANIDGVPIKEVLKNSWIRRAI